MEISWDFCFQAMVGDQSGSGRGIAQLLIKIMTVIFKKFSGVFDLFVYFFRVGKVFVKRIVKVEMVVLPEICLCEIAVNKTDIG